MNDSVILNEWKDLLDVLWKHNATISPNKFVHHVHNIAKLKQKDIFTGWAQNDMTEFLLFMIDCMHNSIARGVNMNIHGTSENTTDNLAVQCYTMLRETYSKEYSEIMDLFYGISVSQITSIDNKEIHSTKPESFFILDLPISNDSITTLYNCMDFYTNNEILSGENAWFNEKTGKKEDVQKKIIFWNFPKVLIITLKRFSYDGIHKIDKHIDFPLDHLNLSKYVRGYNPNQYVYELYGICNHMGNVMGGHYTAYVKNNQNKWIHYNDTNVTIISDLNSIITPNAYCLFYRKKNNLL
jgi:ubiquitin C-terminal hydrolase